MAVAHRLLPLLLSFLPLAAQAAPEPSATGTETITLLSELKGDPPPLRTERYADLTVHLQPQKKARSARLRVTQVRFGRFPAPTELRRYHGRVGLHLYSGETLRDTVRFDFPLGAQAGDPSPENRLLDDLIARGLASQTTVRVPWDESITHLTVVAPQVEPQLRLSRKALNDLAASRRKTTPVTDGGP